GCLSFHSIHAIFILTLNQIPLGTCWFLWIVVPYYFAFSTKIAYIIGNCAWQGHSVYMG
uniref:Uncharacterized protein n=1 Tax=Ursus americanus TaxID=9643 RepID=A0A452RIT8_URSAM